tara:strand:- start:10639 stop:11055 length:417 start_codon:yes stop_codon:yes gene_type:complete
MGSDNDKFYNMFNDTLSNFIKDLINVFPNDNDFKLFKTSSNIVKMANYKKPLELFNLGLNDEFKKNIREKNEDFFLNNDYSDVLNNEDLQKEGDVNNDINNQLILKLKNYWKELDDENKETVWKYFTILLKLCDKIYQ